MTTDAHVPAGHAPAPATHLLVNELIQLRLRADLTQDQLAAMLGVTRQAVSEWESSAGNLRLSTLAGWAAALGCRLELTRGHQPVLRTADGRPARPALRTHVLITGPVRTQILPALLAELPADATLRTSSVEHAGSQVGLATAAQALKGPFAGTGRATTLLLVASEDLAGPAEVEALDVCLSRARAHAWAVVLLAECAASVPDQVRGNIGLHLHAGAADRVEAVVEGKSAQTWHVA